VVDTLLSGDLVMRLEVVILAADTYLGPGGVMRLEVTVGDV
jgi:hypothetical protein